MASINEHTGDSIQTKTVTEKYRDNYDLIFGKKDKKEDAAQQKSLILSSLHHLREQNAMLREENAELSEQYETVLNNLEKLENLLIDLKKQIYGTD